MGVQPRESGAPLLCDAMLTPPLHSPCLTPFTLAGGMRPHGPEEILLVYQTPGRALGS